MYPEPSTLVVSHKLQHPLDQCARTLPWFRPQELSEQARAAASLSAELEEARDRVRRAEGVMLEHQAEADRLTSQLGAAVFDGMDLGHQSHAALEHAQELEAELRTVRHRPSDTCTAGEVERFVFLQSSGTARFRFSTRVPSSNPAGCSLPRPSLETVEMGK